MDSRTVLQGKISATAHPADTIRIAPEVGFSGADSKVHTNTQTADLNRTRSYRAPEGNQYPRADPRRHHTGLDTYSRKENSVIFFVGQKNHYCPPVSGETTT